MLKVGTPAPDFTADSTYGPVHLKDYFGKQHVILFFYPKDETPVCTKQLADAQSSFSEFQRMDTAMIGVNQDDLESHKQFALKMGYRFPLVTDPGRKISTMYGLEMMEEYPDFVERAVFIIDQDGVIQYAVKGNPSTSELMDVIERIS